MKEVKVQLLPQEKVLFYSPIKERLENYRFDVIAYVIIGAIVLPYGMLLLTLLDIFNVISYFKQSIGFGERFLWLSTFVFISIIWTFIAIHYFKALKLYKRNYPLILTDKRIILEKDFLQKTHPIGTFIEGAEKVVFVDATKKESYIYFKKMEKIHRVPLPYLSKYKDDFKKALKSLFEERYYEINLREMRVLHTKKLINEIFQE